MARVVFVQGLFTPSERRQIRVAAERLPDDWRVIVGLPGAASTELIVGGPDFFMVRRINGEGADPVVSLLEKLHAGHR